MKTRKYKLSEIRNLIKSGVAHDLTNATAADVLDQRRRCEKVGYSSGACGINGVLIQESETGEFYAITDRNANLFRIL